MKPRAEHPNMERIKALFREGLHLTALDIEARVFIDRKNARHYLRILKDEDAIHIARWRRDAVQGPPAPVYVWGPGKDAEKPSPLTPAERQARNRACPEFKARDAARKRARRALPKVLAVRSVLSVALHGLRHP